MFVCVYTYIRVRVCASRGSIQADPWIAIEERNVCECERNRSDGSSTADDRSETYNIRNNKIRKRIVSSSFIISNLKTAVITGSFFFDSSFRRL